MKTLEEIIEWHTILSQQQDMITDLITLITAANLERDHWIDVVKECRVELKAERGVVEELREDAKNTIINTEGICENEELNKSNQLMRNLFTKILTLREASITSITDEIRGILNET